MAHLKTEEEIAVMVEGGKRLKKIVNELRPMLRAGIRTREIDREAESLIQKYEGEASFRKVPRYYWNTCLPINEQVVHTPPSDRVVQTGDLLTLDIGLYYRGYHTDYAETVLVGEDDPTKRRFLDVGEETLAKAIGQAKVGNRLGHIALAIQKEMERNSFFVLKELTGHGIGKELHEDPYVPGFLDSPIEKTSLIKPGLVIAIEVIYAMGTERIKYEKGEDWSIVTADGSLSACFEHTVAVTENGVRILTK